jgi:hypothetical protein
MQRRVMGCNWECKPALSNAIYHPPSSASSEVRKLTKEQSSKKDCPSKEIEFITKNLGRDARSIGLSKRKDKVSTRSREEEGNDRNYSFAPN